MGTLKTRQDQNVDFSHATRKLLFGAAPREIPGAGTSAAETPARHTRMKITINLDGDIIEQFKERGDNQGVGYQFLINQALREYLEGTKTERLAKEIGEMLLESDSFRTLLSDRLRANEPALARVK